MKRGKGEMLKLLGLMPLSIMEKYALLAYYTLKLKNNENMSKWKNLIYDMFNSDYEDIGFLYNKTQKSG